MERKPGVSLFSKWGHMVTEQHVQAIRKVAQLCKETYNLQFPAYGSLYFSDVVLEEGDKIHLRNGYCIGPHVGQDFWNSSAGEAELFGNTGFDHGPWRDMDSYKQAFSASAFSRIPPIGYDCSKLPSFQGTIEEHYTLVGQLSALFSEYTTFPQDIIRPTLMHPYLSARNILVSESDPTVITGLLDWHSTAIEPAFRYASTMNPEIARGQESCIVEIREQSRVDMQACSNEFNAYLCRDMPAIHEAATAFGELPHLFHLSRLTWRGGVTTIRENLIKLCHEIGVMRPGVFAYYPSREERDKHAQQMQDHILATGVKEKVVGATLCDADGHVKMPLWEPTMGIYRQLHVQWIEMACEQQGMTKEQAVRLWPFDAR